MADRATDPPRLCVYGVRCDSWEGRQADTLSPDERYRASTFRLTLDRRRYVAARTFLRHVLARYLDVAPAEVEFTYSREGKPGVTGIQFNLAHCEDLFVAAVSNVPVGIDIERPGTTTPALAKRILTTRELARWRRLSSSERRVALTRAWVRKEACAKALGGGARDDFMWSEVGLHQSQGFRRVRVEPASVSLADLDAVPDHIAAVAVVSSVAPLMSVHLVDYESPHLPSLAASFEPAEIAADDEGAEKRIAVVARNV